MAATEQSPLNRLLHLEDNRADAELFWPEIRRAWPGCEIVRVDTERDFVAALEAGGIDLILSDFTLPSFDGLTALAIARERQPEIPFLFLSGTIGEELAVEALKHGATDYILKEHPARLVPAVRRALAEASAHRSRRAAEAVRYEAEDRFRQLAESSRDVFWFADFEPFRIRYVSPAVEQMWGRKPAEFYADPKTWLNSIHPDDRSRVERINQAWLAGDRQHFAEEYRVVHPDGTIRWVFDTGTLERDGSGRTRRMSGVVRDITQAREAAEASLRTQRLESIGLLAGGVAHDLNNALAPVLMSVQLLRQRALFENEPLLNQIESGARRGAAMVRQLLGFARGTEGQRVVLDPRHLLREIEHLIVSTFPKTIKIAVNYPPDLAKVSGDPTLLHQVLLNLAVNARDAMPDGGSLTLEVENTKVDESYAGFIREAKPGAYVLFKVSDTGMGIPPHLLGRIFDPFVTTKPLGSGTGLGLTTVAGITHNHGGFVRVQSEPGKGACFMVFLPAAPSGSTAPFPPQTTSPRYRGHGELTLVVDDEEPVRLLLKELLERLNFRVLLAADGTEALAQFAANREQLRLVLTDERMPHMDGVTLVRTLRHMSTGLRIIAMSGLHDETKVREFAAHHVAHFLHKPFSIADLTKALQDCLGAELTQGELKLNN